MEALDAVEALDALEALEPGRGSNGSAQKDRDSDRLDHMKKLSKKTLLALAAFTLVFGVACPDGAGSQGIPGVYSLEGTNPDGSPYRGTVTIKQEEESYSVEWNIAGQRTVGSGQLDGETLTVDWGQEEPIIYQVQQEGSILQGTWAGGQGSETLTRQSPPEGEEPPEE